MTPQQKQYRQQRLTFAEFIKLYPFTTDDLDGEEWRPIEGYDDYQISSFGRVKSLKKCRGCAVRILRPAISRTNYLIVQLVKNAKPKWYSVHRLVAKAFATNPENKPQVNHVDGCKINAYAGNLEWVTNAENIRHAFDVGLAKPLCGEKHAEAKLTNEQVVYIRNNPDGLNTIELSKNFGVTAATISDVQLGKKYKDAGGKIRKSKIQRLTDEQRNEIKRLYIKGSREFGTGALGRKFGVDQSAIWRIINGK